MGASGLHLGRIKRKEKIPRQQLQQVQQMHREDLLPETASSCDMCGKIQMWKDIIRCGYNGWMLRVGWVGGGHDRL